MLVSVLLSRMIWLNSHVTCIYLLFTSEAIEMDITPMEPTAGKFHKGLHFIQLQREKQKKSVITQL
jgi:hypothetical protein